MNHLKFNLFLKLLFVLKEKLQIILFNTNKLDIYHFKDYRVIKTTTFKVKLS